MSRIGEIRYLENHRSRLPLSSRDEKEAIERRASRQLQKSPYPEVRRVKCEFHEGLLFLHGRVPSYYLKQLAQTAVFHMDGVDEVHNQLEVDAQPY